MRQRGAQNDIPEEHRRAGQPRASRWARRQQVRALHFSLCRWRCLVARTLLACGGTGRRDIGQLADVAAGQGRDDGADGDPHHPRRGPSRPPAASGPSPIPGIATPAKTRRSASPAGSGCSGRCMRYRGGRRGLCSGALTRARPAALGRSSRTSIRLMGTLAPVPASRTCGGDRGPGGCCGPVASGRTAVVLIEGEAGIGKTRLLVGVLEDARGRGMQVARAGLRSWSGPGRSAWWLLRSGASARRRTHSGRPSPRCWPPGTVTEARSR